MRVSPCWVHSLILAILQPFPSGSTPTTLKQPFSSQPKTSIQFIQKSILHLFLQIKCSYESPGHLKNADSDSVLLKWYPGLLNRVPSDINTVHLETECWVASAFRPYVLCFCSRFWFVSPPPLPPLLKNSYALHVGLILSFKSHLKLAFTKSPARLPSRADT